MKIKSIKLNDFKQFENFGIPCRETNILTGPNNAGKSSILDALRICKDVLRFAARNNPELASQEGVGVCATYLLPDSSLSITTENVVRDYGDEYSDIIITSDSNSSLTVKIHPRKTTKAFLTTPGRLPTTASQFRKAFPLNIIVVPTLSPFESKEKWVTDDTVRSNETTRLSSRNFRNIWLRKSKAELQEFNNLIQLAWPDISLQIPEVISLEQIVEMYYIDKRKTREKYWAGFGFQVWLQMMTHILRAKADSVLVLDEPDIYLHPDLQRKLTTIIQQKFGQVFLATHSTEIINEVNAGDVLLIDSTTHNARRIVSDENYRQLFNYLGSSENVEFARMARARRIVFFEGDDRRLLRRFAGKVANAETLDDPDTVFLKCGGFGQWRRVLGVNWTLDNVFGMKIKIAAVFDSDYRCAEEIAQFESDIQSPDILCHVLKKKEIENYALCETSIIRSMMKRADDVSGKLSETTCIDIIDDIFEELYEDTRSNIVGNHNQHLRKTQSKLSESSITKKSLADFEKSWSSRPIRFDLVGGKAFISSLSSRLHREIGKSVTLALLVQEMRVNEVAPELTRLISDMETFFK